MKHYVIINDLARAQIVEKMILNITKRATLTDDLQDAAQTVYGVLLTYREDIIAEAVQNNELRFLVARIILNTLKWRGSEYHDIVDWNARRSPITDNLKNKADE